MKATDREARLAQIGVEIGKLVAEKNAAYGSSFELCGDFLRILWPQGIPPEDYTDALLLVRLFDKMIRIATNKGAFDESPWKDIAGYGICGTYKDEKESGT